MIDRRTIRWMDRVVSIQDMEQKYNLMRIRKKSFHPGFLFFLFLSLSRNSIYYETYYTRYRKLHEERIFSRWRCFEKVKGCTNIFVRKETKRSIWMMDNFFSAPSFWSFIYSL